jgi:hypothetical protein
LSGRPTLIAVESVSFSTDGGQCQRSLRARALGCRVLACRVLGPRVLRSRGLSLPVPCSSQFGLDLGALIRRDHGLVPVRRQIMHWQIRILWLGRRICRPQRGHVRNRARAAGKRAAQGERRQRQRAQCKGSPLPIHRHGPTTQIPPHGDNVARSLAAAQGTVLPQLKALSSEPIKAKTVDESDGAGL